MRVNWKPFELVGCFFQFEAFNDRLAGLVINLHHTMRQFWQIDELVRMVASDLEKRCGVSNSVLALACCSKQLSDIVLDSLWEELDGLGPLMRCLPSETWEIRDDGFVRMTLVYSHLSGSSPVNRRSYVSPPPRNGSDSRVMLVGSASFTQTTRQENRDRQCITYYLCRPQL